MNPHHLELFHYVATHQGISRAARAMPYGIQQPAISKQITQLEDYLGLSLFERQPFALTPAGQFVHERSAPFFVMLGTLREQVQQFRSPLLRIASSEFIASEYLPEVVARFRQQCPETRVVFQAASTTPILAGLAAGEIDLAVAALDRMPHNLQCQPIVQLPLALLVPKSLPRPAREALWEDVELSRQFVSPPTTEGIAQRFLDELRQRGQIWSPVIETSSTASVTAVVASGQGVGVSLHLPRLVKHAKVRALPLREFQPVTVTLLWREPASPAVEAMRHVITTRARELWPAQAV